MSITVQDCLKLPSFHFGRLVAGRDALDKIVSSVSVVEIPASDQDIKVFNPNELSITSFYAIKDDPSAHCTAVRNLAENGVVALVLFYVGNVVAELFDDVIQTADQLSLPLIVIEDEQGLVKYSDIITDVMTAVISDQMTATDFVGSTKNRLQQIPESKRSMENLLKIISSSYKCNLLLYSSAGLYFNSVYRPSYGAFESDFFLSSFQDDPPGYSWKTTSSQGNTYYIYKMDFSHEGNSWMTLYVSCSDNRIDEAMMNDMCACTNYFSSLWGYSLDMQSSRTALSLILKASKITAEKFLLAAGISPSDIPNLLIFSAAEEYLPELRTRVEQIFEEYDKFCIADIIDHRLVLLTSLKLSGRLDALLVQELERIVYRAEFPASFFLDGGARDIPALRRVYAEFCSNISAMDKIFLHRKYRDMHDVIFAQEIIGLSQKRNVRKAHIQAIIQLLKDDRDDLLETLAVYFIDCNAQLNTTAETLFLHRNTVSYRLNKIKRLSNTDFTKMPAAYDYYLAAALWRFSRN